MIHRQQLLPPLFGAQFLPAKKLDQLDYLELSASEKTVTDRAEV